MAKTSPFSLRLRPEVLREIRAVAKQLRRPSSQIASTLIEEGLRLRRCPGVVFTDGPTGRRATVAGSGIDVWEVIRVYRTCGQQTDELAQALPQLSRRQLEAALYYYRCYPQEIEERLAREEMVEAELAGRFPLVKSYPL